jgi:hypothetical protein
MPPPSWVAAPSGSPIKQAANVDAEPELRHVSVFFVCSDEL